MELFPKIDISLGLLNNADTDKISVIKYIFCLDAFVYIREYQNWKFSIIDNNF